MTLIYILLGVIIFSLIRIFGIAKENSIKLQNLSLKVHSIYEQLLKEKVENETKKE